MRLCASVCLSVFTSVCPMQTQPSIFLSAPVYIKSNWLVLLPRTATDIEKIIHIEEYPGHSVYKGVE
jgi:hypothetical protein